MMRTPLATIAVAIAIAGCNSASGFREQESKPRASSQTVAAPTRKDVLSLLLANSDVPLTVHPSCNNIGSKQTDSQIGQYIAGLLAEYSEDTGKNWVEVIVSPTSRVEERPSWTSRVTFRHQAGDDEWGWGVQFEIVAAGRSFQARRDSFECRGAG